jgi:hypothetical protein
VKVPLSGHSHDNASIHHHPIVDFDQSQDLEHAIYLRDLSRTLRLLHLPGQPDLTTSTIDISPTTNADNDIIKHVFLCTRTHSG